MARSLRIRRARFPAPRSLLAVLVLGAITLGSDVLGPDVLGSDVLGWDMLGSSVSTAEATIASLVYINGVPTRVYFNDGDSFRQLTGRWAGQGSRLEGFNTLESFGPVHSWGDWHPFELWVNAKKATHNARHGIWHCTTEGEQDTYGRVLLDCPDLAVSQIRHGYAHAMQIDDTPARPAYLRAQQEAIRHRRGMWSHGVPGFVVTSLHSADEDPTRDGHYNRMVSTRDGHTEKWEHSDRYPECTTQCATEIQADAEAVERVARRLREDPDLKQALHGFANLLLVEAVDRFARLGSLPEYLEPAQAQALLPKLEEAKARNELGRVRTVEGACMLYMDFRRRYGRDRAHCLRGHGAWPPNRSAPASQPESR